MTKQMDELSIKCVIAFLVINVSFIVSSFFSENLKQFQQTMTQLQNTQKSITVTISSKQGK